MPSQFIDNFIDKYHLSHDFFSFAKGYLIPIAERILSQSSQSSEVFFAGINGCQGAGKSTIATFIQAYLHANYHLNVVNMSLDDFYLSQSQCLKLAHNIHPLLKTRGVPGTHDVEKLIQVLTSLKNSSGQLEIPRFSKLDDNPSAPYKVKLPIDLVLIEGWCWGVDPQSVTGLILPCNAMESVHDNNLLWRNYVNTRLSEDYVPLYHLVNFWLFIKAPSFTCVYQWRLQQEEKLRAKHVIENQTKTLTAIMSNDEVAAFILLFQRLTEHALATMSDKADITLSLNKERLVECCDGL